MGGVHTLAPRHPATSDARRLSLAKWSAVPVSTAERRGDEVSSLGAGLNPRGRGGKEPEEGGLGARRDGIRLQAALRDLAPPPPR